MMKNRISVLEYYILYTTFYIGEVYGHNSRFRTLSEAKFHRKCRNCTDHVEIRRRDWCHLPDNVLIGKGKFDFLQ